MPKPNTRARNPDLNDSVSLEMDTAEAPEPNKDTPQNGLPGFTNTAEASAPNKDTPRKGPPGPTNTGVNSTNEGNIRNKQSEKSNIRHNPIDRLNISLEQGTPRSQGKHGNPHDKIEQANIRMFNYLHINPDEYNISGDQLKNVVDRCFSYAIISGAFKEIHNQLRNIAEAIPFIWPAPPQSFRSLEDLKTWAKEQSRIWEKYNISAVLQRQQSRSTELIKEPTIKPREESSEPPPGERNDRPDPSDTSTRNNPEEQRSRYRERSNTRPPASNRPNNPQNQSNRHNTIETKKDNNPTNIALVAIRNSFSEADLIKQCKPDEDGEPSPFKIFTGYRSRISKWAKNCVALQKDPDNRFARKHYPRYANDIKTIIEEADDDEEKRRMIGKAYRAVSKDPELHSFFHPKPPPPLTSMQIQPQHHTQQTQIDKKMLLNMIATLLTNI